MEVIVKYTGAGIFTRGQHFRADINEGLYKVSKEDADYLTSTFPDSFVLIEKVVEKKPAKKPASKPRTTRKKKEEAPKEEE